MKTYPMMPQKPQKYYTLWFCGALGGRGYFFYDIPCWSQHPNHVFCPNRVKNGGCRVAGFSRDDYTILHITSCCYIHTLRVCGTKSNNGCIPHVPWCLLFEGTALPLGQRYGKIISFPSALDHNWGYPLFSDKPKYHILGYIYIYMYITVYYNIIYVYTYPRPVASFPRWFFRVAVAPGLQTESLVPGESQWRGADARWFLGN